MKLMSLIPALALAVAVASPSFTAPYSTGAHLTAKSSTASAVTSIVQKKGQRTKTKAPEKPRCFAWPGGCTNT